MNELNVEGRTPTETIPRMSLPAGCINSSALRSLANALDRIAAWHGSCGGSSPDVECLTDVEALAAGGVIAHVRSGDHTFVLEYIAGAWVIPGLADDER